MKPGVFEGKKFPFTPKRRKKSLGSQCNNIIDARHDLAAFRSKLANVSWLRSYTSQPTGTYSDHSDHDLPVEPECKPQSLQTPESDHSKHDLPSEPGNPTTGDRLPPLGHERLQCRPESGVDTKDASDVEGESEVRVTTDVPRGPKVTQQHLDTVNEWWQSEIEAWKSIILGFSGYEAKRYDSMNQWDQWIYRKYRFDHHFFYHEVAPPPLEMWE